MKKFIKDNIDMSAILSGVVTTTVIINIGYLLLGLWGVLLLGPLLATPLAFFVAGEVYERFK